MSAPALFEIDNLHAGGRFGDTRTTILRGVNLTVSPGEVHALLGPAGSGKTALAATLLGGPHYQVTDGAIRLLGDDITEWGADVRGKAGMFLGFPHPEEIPGVSLLNVVRRALAARKGIDMSIPELRLAIIGWMERLDMDPALADRFLNEGLSGDEKRRSELLQMAVLDPEIAVLDETDLALDSLEVLGRGLQEVRKDRPELAAIVITHVQRSVDRLAPDHVHILMNGQIVESGTMELAERVEREGYESWR